MLPLADAELTAFAREHLVYEGRMLGYAAVRLAERDGIPRDPESNALLEAFAIHVRVLRDFLWRDRQDYPRDAFASDFCAQGEWARLRGELPPALSEIGRRCRLDREIVHLSYDRLTVEAERKDWDVGDIFSEIADRLSLLSSHAQPSRMDAKTRTALHDLLDHAPGVGSTSVATGAVYGLAIQGGTIAFPGFQAGS